MGGMSMNVKVFIDNFRKAFGEVVELPLAFWYSDRPARKTVKINGCLFKGMKEAREGGVISLDAEVVGCGGGKYYCGFTDLPDRIPGFVSLKERYKKTPEMVTAFLADLALPRAPKPYLNFTRVDKIDRFDLIEGLVFFASPDVLTGLVAWTFFDTNESGAVTTSFGSGCSSIISEVVLENRKEGQRTFLGLFDPSVRPYVEADKLSFAIPMSRFKVMYHTLTECCLMDTHAWGKVRERINS